MDRSDGLMVNAFEEALKNINVNNIPEDLYKKDFTDYKNNAYNVVSAVGYLIGVSKALFDDEENPAMMSQVYKKLQLNKQARIIRNLCIIRNALEHNYLSIATSFATEITNLGTLPKYIPSEAVNELYEDGVSITKSKPDVDQYIISLNKEISNRISNVQSVFPEWLNWQYVKELFIMPNGYTVAGIKAEGDHFNSNRNRYPYQCYINWSLDDVGNILYCDEKFVKLVYELHEDYFSDLSLVRNAGDLTVDSINDFLMASEKTIFVVDCENSNPVKLASVLGGLDDEVKQKITDVLLFDSHYTMEGWSFLSEENEETNDSVPKSIEKTVEENLFDWGSLNDTAGINMTHIVVDRLLESKSQVDMTLAVRTTQEVYKNNVDSVVLVSSDSDYWAMISNLPDVKFLVMLEKSKTSRKIIEQLDSKGHHHCFLDDFYTGVSYTIKTDSLKNYIQTYFDTYLSFDVNKLLDNAIYNSWIDMTDKEKKAFLDKYIRKAHAEIDGDGKFKMVLGEK